MFIATYRRSGVTPFAKKCHRLLSKFARVAIGHRRDHSCLLQGRACVILALLLLQAVAPAAGQTPVFVGQIGSTGEDSAEDVAADAAGNFVVTGSFRETVDFDLTDNGSTNLTSDGSEDIFVAKYDPIGTLIWAIRIGGGGSDFGNGVTIDGEGNILVTGCFDDTVDFDPGAGVHYLTTTGGSDIFVLKLTPDGIFQWAFGTGGSDSDAGHDIGVDAAGNVYVTGGFSQTADFDPGPDSFDLTSDGELDFYLAKYDPDGNLNWALSSRNGSSNDRGWGLTVNDDGYCYVSGWFKNSPDMDPGPSQVILNSNGKSDAWLGKYDPDGNILWAFNLGGVNRDQAFRTALDANGNLFVVGYFRDAVDFDPGPGDFTLTTVARQAAYLAKYDGNGNFLWAISGGHENAQEDSQALAVTVDAAGNAVVVGLFVGAVDMDPTTAIHQLEGIGSNASFAASYDPDGSLNWAFSLDGPGGDNAQAVASDVLGNILIAGKFRLEIDMDPDSGFPELLTSAGFSDIFLGLYSTTVDLPPVADFSYVENNLLVEFDASASADDGTIVSWEWDFGDGNTGSGELTTHSYAAPGTYSVSLTVTDDRGASDSNVQAIAVGNPVPIANFVTSQTAGTLDVHFDGSSSSDDGFVVAWDWDLGDGSATSGELVTHSYADPGTYVVVLTVTDNEGATGSHSSDVVVEDNEDPVPSFTTSQAPGTLEVEFDGSGSTDDGAVITWDWNFGDGTSGVGVIATHTYSIPGTYAVTLTVTDDFGATATLGQDLEVASDNLDPIAAFTTTQRAGEMTVDFDGSSSSDDGTVTNWSWDFGDGNVGTGEFTSHQYANAGPFTVSLTVTDDEGSTGSTSSQVIVTDPLSDDPFLEENGMVVIEAESYHQLIDRSSHGWQANTTHAGFSGQSAMESTPDNSTTITTDIQATSPELVFDVVITTVGDYYLWFRLLGVDNQANSIHAGIDSTIHPSSRGIQTQVGEWNWELLGRGNSGLQHEISAVGTHTVNIWMREDGTLVDKLVLTTDAGFVPSGEGPPESPRSEVPAQVASGEENTAQSTSQPLLDSVSSQIEGVVLPREHALGSNYPNPFYPVTRISYSLSETANMSLQVMDLLGRLVSHVEAGIKPAGIHSVVFDGTTLPAGIYLYRLEVAEYIHTKTMVLVR